MDDPPPPSRIVRSRVEWMPTDTASIRSDAIRLLVIATAVMGFGFFNDNLSLSFLDDAFDSKWIAGVSGKQLLGLSILIWFGNSLGFYVLTVFSVGRLLLRDNLVPKDLRNPFLAMTGTILAVSILFLVSIIGKDIRQRPGLEIAGGDGPWPTMGNGRQPEKRTEALLAFAPHHGDL